MPTIYDVAEAAGVSIATVSRVFSGRAPVTDASRERVLAAADALGYRPNRMAQALAGGRTKALGLVMPFTLSNPFYTRIAEALIAHGRQRGFEILFALAERTDPDSYIDAQKSLLDRQVQGLLIVSNTETAHLCREALPGDPPPMAAVGCLPERGLPLATVDEEDGGYRATRHLIELGHRRIAFLGLAGMPPRPLGREHGYLRAMEEAQVEAHAIDTPVRLQDGEQALDAVLRQVPDATAVFAQNDALAIGLLRALAERGIRAPGELSVAGFDDLPMSALTVPSLTTVRVPVDAIAVEAMRLLLDSGDNGCDRQVVIGPELVARESTGPPRGS
ncbi:MAG: LacI family DNA-binding transcriptional regulator [Armatimonadia bacterium]|nr:LacI family DNA-binding transcriptional regulator [Armatimonadia bacterium]